LGNKLYNFSNDFLPSLPSLKIREGAIDILIYLYKLLIPTLDDYLTESGYLNLKQFQILISKLALVEEAFFKNFMKTKENDKRNVDTNERIWNEFVKKRDLKNIELGKKGEDVLFKDFYKSIDEIAKANKPDKQENLNENDIQNMIVTQASQDKKDILPNINQSIDKQNEELFNKSLKSILQVMPINKINYNVI